MKPEKMPNGEWRVRAFIGRDQNGKQIRKIFRGADKRSVMAEATAFLNEHRSAMGNATIRAATSAYIASKTASLSPSTIRGYAMIERHLNGFYAHFMDIGVLLVTAEDVQEVIDGLSGEGMTGKTVRNYSSFISSVLKSKNVRMPIVDLPPKDKPDYNIPDVFTVQRILKAAEKDTELWICVSLGAKGPLRAGEVAALTIEDCDFQNSTIHVAHDMVMGIDGIYHIKPPKTVSSDRVLKMSDEIMDAIKRQGYVTNWHPHLIYQKFSRLLATEGIPHCRFHDLRHYCASLLHAKGYPDVYIQARTGHATSSVLRDVYTHTLTDQREKIEDEMIRDLDAVN